VQKIPKGATQFDIPVAYPVYGDVKVQLGVIKGRTIQHMCHVWYNTGFIDPSTNSLTLEKKEIDVANKDKKNAHFKPEFKLEFQFETIEVEKADDKTKKIVEKTKADKKTIHEHPTMDSSEEYSSPDVSDDEDTKKPKKTKKPAAAAAATATATATAAAAAAAASPDSDKKEPKKPAGDGKTSPKPAATDAKPTTEAKPEDTFEKRRKRAQSFYDGDEEDEEMDDSEREEKELQQYFETEELEGSTDSSKQPLSVQNSSIPTHSTTTTTTTTIITPITLKLKLQKVKRITSGSFALYS